LICESPFKAEDFATIDYLWFSHEHPDHFTPAVLKAIPPEIRAKITVLFHATKDGKVLRFCKDLGFQTMELAQHRKYQLTPEIEIICGAVPFFDSWIYYKLGEQRILNVNDCVVDGDAKCEEIQRVTGPVDVLFTQFSYAAWKGNEIYKEMREESARSKLQIVEHQTHIFKPKYTIPFASYVYFSHEENRYINDSVNTPERAAATIAAAGSTPIVMFPGDRWTPGETWDNNVPLQKWRAEYARLPR
jgi:UDP-MurNAc hydroxylase